jgi:hypothetical protein
VKLDGLRHFSRSAQVVSVVVVVRTVDGLPAVVGTVVGVVLLFCRQAATSVLSLCFVTVDRTVFLFSSLLSYFGDCFIVFHFLIALVMLKRMVTEIKASLTLTRS